MDCTRCIACLIVLCLTVGAANAASLRATPSVDVSETFTSNSGSTANGDSDWITELRPSIRLFRPERGHIQGDLTASLRNVYYAGGTRDDRSFVTLSGKGTAELVDDRFFIDATAHVSRDNSSLLSGRPQGDGQSVDSSDETRRFSLTPRFQMKVGRDLEISAQYRMTWLSGGSNVLEDRDTSGWSASVRNRHSHGLFGWGLDYSRQAAQGSSRNVESQVARGTLYANLSRQLSLRAIYGWERNDYRQGKAQESVITGGGLDWIPSPRTKLSATMEDRFFGTGYDLSFNHRAARTAWNLTYGRDASSVDQPVGGTLVDYYYDLFSALIDEPDPYLKDQKIRELLRILGFDVTGPLGNFVTNTYFVNTRLRAGVTLIGARNTLAFTLFRSDRSRLSSDLADSVQDDFFANDRVRDLGFTATLSHKISELTSLRVSATTTKATGSSAVTSTSNIDTRRKTISVGLDRRFGPGTSGSLTYRYSDSSGGSEFSENSLRAALAMRF
jgi:uncharacterized protein (PEP-CTERM system associated)